MHLRLPSRHPQRHLLLHLSRTLATLILAKWGWPRSKPHAAAAETGPASPRNVRLRRSAARLPSPHRCRLGATAADKLDLDLDIAAGRGLEEAVVQSTQIGAVNSWLRGQPAEVVATAIGSIREALAAHVDGATVRLPGAMRLVSSAPA